MPGSSIVSSSPKSNMVVQAPTAARPNLLGTLALVIPTVVGAATAVAADAPLAIVAGAALGLVGMFSPKIAQHWERAVVLRFGRYAGLRGPGPFFVIPFVDSISAWVDQRTVTTAFTAEETLTSTPCR
jgi:hypothetical protein